MAITNRAIEIGADDLTNMFYWIAQEMIQEEDGGVADLVEVDVDFRGSIALPLIKAVRRRVGDARLSKGVSAIFDTGTVVEPVCAAQDIFSPEVAEQAAAEVSILALRAVYRAFPELGGNGLEDYMAFAASKSSIYLRAEANFREADFLIGATPRR
jgi:hypothetical protein